MLNLLGPLASLVIKTLTQKKTNLRSVNNLRREIDKFKMSVEGVEQTKNSVKRVQVQSDKKHKTPLSCKKIKNIILLTMLFIFVIGTLKIVEVDHYFMNFIKDLLAFFVMDGV